MASSHFGLNVVDFAYSRKYRYILALTLIIVNVSLVKGNLYLDKISTLYLPFRPSAVGRQAFMFPANILEASAYDKEHHVIYSAGNKYLRAIDANDQRNMEEFTHVEVNGAEFTDVKVCGNYVISTLSNTDMRHLGKVVIYNKLTPQIQQMTLLHSITVGSNPDSIAISSDCRTIVVCLEGRAYTVSQSMELIDPEGGVGVIHFDRGISAYSSAPNVMAYTYTKLNFTKFNPRTEELINLGVRFIYRIKNNTLSRDLEPEYVTLSADEKTAYVVLQENNAIATVDLTYIDRPEVTKIIPLGYKNWNVSAFDASDADGKINLLAHPVYGMFQPDQIAYKVINGVPYIFTANEGSDKHYPEVGWTEVKRGKDFVEDGMITKDAPITFVKELTDTNLLGRLEFTMDDGAFIYTGVYKELYTFGARSFSMFRADDMTLVFDSGDHIEKSHASELPWLFNADSKRYMNTIEATADLRSDNKGPECEAITLGDIGDRTVIFVGNEKPGTVSIYSISNQNPGAPRFESVNYGGKLVAGQTWQQSYENRTIGDIDPESILFIPAADNPSGMPLLIVTGTVSGTISLYAIKDNVEQAVVPLDSLPPTEVGLIPVVQDIQNVPKRTNDIPPSVPHGSVVVADQEVQECPIYHVKCRNYMKCVPRQLRCDGVDDCGDWSDEVNCKNELLEQIFMLGVAAVTLGALGIVISLLACCFLKKRSLSYEKYEMKTRV